MPSIRELNSQIPNFRFPDVLSMEVEPGVHLDIRVGGAFVARENGETLKLLL